MLTRKQEGFARCTTPSGEVYYAKLQTALVGHPMDDMSECIKCGLSAGQIIQGRHTALVGKTDKEAQTYVEETANFTCDGEGITC